MADDRLDDARPTVLLDGVENEELRQGLLSLTITENTEGLYRCEASFGNQGSSGRGVDFRYFDRQLLDFGKSLKIDLKGASLFEGRVMALEARFPSKGTPELVVLADDALQDLRMTRRTRTFVDQSDAEVFDRIADDHKMEKGVRGLTGAKHRVLAQLNQSDLAFLRDRARAIEAEIWVTVGASGKPVLNARPRAARATGAPVKLGWRNELQDFTVLADLAHQRTAVVASGWNVSAKDRVTYSASDVDLGAELGGTDSGAAILRSKFSERKESIAHGTPFNQGEAEERAKAHFKMGARRFVVGRGVARTNAELRVGAVADLDGLGPLFSGKYYLSEVRHCFDSVRGLRTEFCAERPGLGQP